MIGRKIEKEKLEQLLISGRSEFLAVTGRRRVGKTYLIDALLGGYYYFSMIGIQNGSRPPQYFDYKSPDDSKRPIIKG